MTTWSSSAALLLMVASCGCQTSASAPELFLLDLNSYSPAIGYSTSGRVLRTERTPECSQWIKIRDVTGRATLQSERSSRTSLPVMVARDFAGREIGRYPFAAPDVQDVRLSPSGEKVALAGGAGRPGLRCKTGIFVAERGEVDWAPAWCAPDNATAPTSVTWSPDEQALAFSYCGQIYVLGARDRQARVLAEGDRARWAPVGDQIVVVRGDELWLVASSGAVAGRRLAHVEGLVSSGTEWSPDGQSISVVSKSASQPGDSRVRTELGLVQVQSSDRMTLGVKLWGLAPNLRWVPRRAEEFGAFIESRSTLCGVVPQTAW